MVVEVLAADARSGMEVGIVAPGEDTGMRDVDRQEFAKPVDAIAGGPGVIAMAVEAMDGDDTTGEKQSVGSS